MIVRSADSQGFACDVSSREIADNKDSEKRTCREEQILFPWTISANAAKSEIKIARWFFVHGRERNCRSPGGEARVATKDDNNINALSTRLSSRERKKSSSENEQLVNCSPPGHNRNVSRTRAERVCLNRPVSAVSQVYEESSFLCACPLARHGESELKLLDRTHLYLPAFHASYRTSRR